MLGFDCPWCGAIWALGTGQRLRKEGMGEAEEEIEVINSIYEDAAEYTKESGIVKLAVPDTNTKLTLWLPPDYPQEPPRVRAVSGLADDKAAVESLQVVVDSLFQPGEVFLYTLLDETRDDIAKMEEAQREAAEMQEEARRRYINALSGNTAKGSMRIAEWSVSGEVRDRGSVFIGRAHAAANEAELDEVVEDLLCDKKVANATINMIAWRIETSEGVFAQDFDDGGEAGAGACMLHVLKMGNVKNAVVVVSRYFSGQHIGPDRFKHIKNCARDALVEGGFL